MFKKIPLLQLMKVYIAMQAYLKKKPKINDLFGKNFKNVAKISKCLEN